MYLCIYTSHTFCTIDISYFYNSIRELLNVTDLSCLHVHVEFDLLSTVLLSGDPKNILNSSTNY